MQGKIAPRVPTILLYMTDPEFYSDHFQKKRKINKKGQQKVDSRLNSIRQNFEVTHRKTKRKSWLVMNDVLINLHIELHVLNV